MSALDTQVGGSHYREGGIQPVQYIEANGLKFLEGCVVKRVTRHDRPTGKGRQDIEKAIHELQLLLELRYPLVDVEVRNESACGGKPCPMNFGGAPYQPTHPAWPEDKVYRWMCQSKDGIWWATSDKPYLDGDYWLGGGHRVVDLTRECLNPNWRDTLIERGADE